MHVSIIYRVRNIAFSTLVVKCQGLIRRFAGEQVRKLGVDENDAKHCATSCVSQRDIQVFRFMKHLYFINILTEGIYILLLDYQNI